MLQNQQNKKQNQGLFPKSLENSEIQNKLDEIKDLEEQVNRNDWVYKSSKYKYDFRNIPAMRSCSNRIFFGKITISEADKKESNLTKAILQFNDKVRLRSKACKKEKTNAHKNFNALYEGLE